MDAAPPLSRRLCLLTHVADGGSDRFAARVRGRDVWVMVIRRGERVFTCVNSCPHIGSPLDFKPGQFLNAERTHILCTTHSALFRIDDGFCVSGPCAGDRLEGVASEVRDGIVYVADGGDANDDADRVGDADGDAEPP